MREIKEIKEIDETTLFSTSKEKEAIEYLKNEDPEKSAKLKLIFQIAAFVTGKIPINSSPP